MDEEYKSSWLGALEGVRGEDCISRFDTSNSYSITEDCPVTELGSAEG